MIRSRHSLPWLSLLLLWACGTPARRTAGDTATLEVVVELDSDGSARVIERYRLTARDPASARLSRNLHVHPTGFWTRQEITDASLADDAGRRLPLKTRAYGEWVNLDLGEVPPDGVFALSYTVSPFFADRASLRWTIVGIAWNLTLTDVRLRLIDGGRAGFGDLAARLDYLPCETCRFGTADDGFTFSTGGPVAAGEVLELTGRRRAPTPAADTLVPAVRRLWPQLAWLGAVLASSVLGLFLGALGRNRLVRALNWSLLIPAGLLLYRSTGFWIHELAVRPGDLDSMIGEFLWNPVALVLIAAFVALQNRSLARWEKRAWHLQHGTFLVSLLLLPVAEPGAWLFPLGALAPLVFWSRRSTAAWFGAGLYEVAEHVRSLGETTITEAAARFRTTPGHLAFLLGREGHSSVVLDPGQGRLLSADNARLLEDVRICPHCGGADLTTRGAGHAACAFCGRERVGASGERHGAPPVPVLVEAVATFFSFLAGVAGTLAALAGAVFLSIGLTSGDDLGEAALVAAFVAVLPALVAWRAAVFASTLRGGGGLARLRFWLFLSAPLVLPLFVLRALSSRRVQSHFGRLELRGLEEALRRSPMDLSAFARWLGTDEAEAADLAAHLCASGLLPAVFDRRLARLAHLELYRTLAREDACCLRCGGSLGIADGAVRCQYCDAAPDA